MYTVRKGNTGHRFFLVIWIQLLSDFFGEGVFFFIILVESCIFCPGAALDHDLPTCGLPSSWDYRLEPLHLAQLLSLLKHFIRASILGGKNRIIFSRNISCSGEGNSSSL
jgi:hypothetical protein